MASLLFPDAGSRLALTTAGRPAASTATVIYADADGVGLAEIYADIAGIKGALTADATIVTDAYGFLPLFWGPDSGTDRLYVRVGDGPIWPIDADYNARLDTLATQVAVLGSVNSPGIVEHAADTTAVHGIADTGLLETTATAQTRVAAHSNATTNVHGIPDTAVLETQSGAQAKADAGRDAALAASAQRAANLSDLADAAASRGNLGLGNSATRNVGTTSGDVVAGNDARLADARTPLSHASTHGAAGADPVTVTQAQVTGLAATLSVKADLIDGIIPTGQIPDLVVNAIYPVESEAEMLASLAAVGDLAVRVDLDPAQAYILLTSDPSVLANWRTISTAGTVFSVNGQSGVITLTAADVGAVPTSRTFTAGTGLTGGGDLSVDRTMAVAYGTTAGTATAGDDTRITGAAQKSANLSDLASASTARTNLGLGSVNNTADTDKPVSTAQAAAITAAVATKAPANGVYVATDPQWGYTSGAELAAACTAAIAAMPSTGGTLFIPPGAWTFAGAVVLKSNVTVQGAGRQASRITGPAGIFTWTATLHDVHIEHLYLRSNGGHIFAPSGGSADHAIYLATIQHCVMWVNHASSSILHHVSALDYDKVCVVDCDLYRHASATVPGWNVVNSGGAANENIWRNLRVDSNEATATPFFHLESTLAGNFAYDNRFEDITGERNCGGVIRALSCMNLTVSGVSEWDAAITYQGDMVRVGKSATAGTPTSKNVDVFNCGRRVPFAQYGSTYDVNLVPGEVNRGSIVSVHNSGTTGKINFGASDNINVFNAPAGSWTGQQANVYNRFGAQTAFANGIYIGAAADTAGTGSPEGVVAGNVGDVFRRTNGAAGTTLYTKESGTGNTGWVTAATASTLTGKTDRTDLAVNVVRDHGAVGDCAFVDQRVTGAAWGLPAATPVNAATYGRGYTNIGYTVAATDNTTAFRAAWDALVNAGVLSLREKSTGVYTGYRALRRELYIPAGAYYIADAGALFSHLRASPNGTQAGITIRGDGQENTVLYVRIPNSGSTDYLVHDVDKMNRLEMRDLTIICTTGTERLFYSESNTGQTGRWYFQRVSFWEYLTCFTLGGTVNVDRWVLEACDWQTSVAQACLFYNHTNSQAVDYVFVGPTITHFAGGNIFDIAAGGNIKLIGGAGRIASAAADGGDGVLIKADASTGLIGQQTWPALTAYGHRLEIVGYGGLCDVKGNTEVVFKDCNAVPVSVTRTKPHCIIRSTSRVTWDGGIWDDMTIGFSTTYLTDYTSSNKASMYVRNAKVMNSSLITSRTLYYTSDGDGLTTVFGTSNTGGPARGRLFVEGCDPYAVAYGTTRTLINGAPYAWYGWHGRPARVHREIMRQGSALGVGLGDETQTCSMIVPNNCEIVRVGIVKGSGNVGIGGNSRTWSVKDADGTTLVSLTALGTDTWVKASAEINRVVTTFNTRTLSLSCAAASPSSVGTYADGYWWLEYV